MTLDARLIELDVRSPDEEGATPRHGVARVHGQIDDDLFDLAAVGMDHAQTRLQNQLGFDVFTDHAAQDPIQVLEDHVQVENARLERNPAAEGEQLPSKGRRPLSGFQDLLRSPSTRIVRIQLALQHLAVTVDHCK